MYVIAAVSPKGKSAGSDKKLFKSLEEHFQVELSKSPESQLSSSPFGPLTDSSSRKTLIYLISILNASFPDYDFWYTLNNGFLTIAMHNRISSGRKAVLIWLSTPSTRHCLPSFPTLRMILDQNFGTQ